MDLSILGDIIACGGLFYIFFEMFEWRIDRKKVLYLFIILLTCSSILYAISLEAFPEQSISVFSSVFFTIPGILLTLLLSKYRDSRLVFTYCTVDMIGFVVSMALKIGVKFYSLNEITMIVISFIAYMLLGLYARKHQKKYWNMLQNLTGCWRLLAVLSAFAYFMLYYQTIFPEPLQSRIEYLPSVLLFNMFIIIVFVVIIFSLNVLVKNQEYLIQLKEVEMYKKYSYYDILTGLQNRRAFEERLANLTGNHQPFGYGIIDLNGLKEINDTLGHGAGDKELQKLSNYLLSLNLQGTAYRIGGDEFTILLEQDCRSQCIDSFESINQGFGKKTNQIDAAIGYGYFDDYTLEDIMVFMNDIDQLMYKKKNEIKSTV